MSTAKVKKIEYKEGQVFQRTLRDLFSNDIVRSFEFVILEVAPTFKGKKYSRSAKVRCIKNSLATTLPSCGSSSLNTTARLARLNKIATYSVYSYRNHKYSYG